MSGLDGRTRAAAVEWLAQGRAAVVVTVQETRGSVPRATGTRMLVADPACIGTIGGGHLELKAIESARRLLRTHDQAGLTQHYPLGPALGQCCGGAVTLAFERLSADVLARWPACVPLFDLQLYGAGHVGRAIAHLLNTLDVRVTWIDEREAEFGACTPSGAPWQPHIAQVCVDAIEGEVRLAPPGAYYLVLTHNHDLDLRITEAILRRGDFGYLGLIGSKTKRQRFIHRFEQRGIAPEAISRMTCPIGVPGITAKQPELIAIAVVAQLLQFNAAPS